MNARRTTLYLALIAAVVASGCGSFRKTSTCTIAHGPGGRLRLYRAANDPHIAADGGGVSFTASATGRGLANNEPTCSLEHDAATPQPDDCEISDDIEALTGGALVVGPAGAAHQPVCPTIQQHITCEKAADPGPSCRNTTCPNLQLKIESSDGMVAHVLMNDDPACRATQHSSPCSAAPKACYYRIYRVVELTLTGPAQVAP